jgi:hypothetical protein
MPNSDSRKAIASRKATNPAVNELSESPLDTVERNDAVHAENCQNEPAAVPKRPDCLSLPLAGQLVTPPLLWAGGPFPP